MILRPGKTLSGKEVRAWLRRLIKRIRRHWPKTRITIRGDSHYGREEAGPRHPICGHLAEKMAMSEAHIYATVYCARGQAENSDQAAQSANRF